MKEIERQVQSALKFLSHYHQHHDKEREVSRFESEDGTMIWISKNEEWIQKIEKTIEPILEQ